MPGRFYERMSLISLPEQTNSIPMDKKYPTPVVPVGGAATAKTAPTTPATPALQAVPASNLGVFASPLIALATTASLRKPKAHDAHRAP